MPHLVSPRGRHPSLVARTGRDNTQQQIPGAQTDPADGITWYQATLHGHVQTYNQDCTWSFDYGKTTSYGLSTPAQDIPASGLSQPVQVTIKSLAPTTTYHFRLRVTSKLTGLTGFGSDVVLVTQAIGGATPSVLGTAPVVNVGNTTHGPADNFVYDSATGTVSCSLHGNAASGTNANNANIPTTVVIGIRRKNTGAGFAFYNDQSIITKKVYPLVDPLDASAIGLLVDTDYEMIVQGTNLKGVTQTDPGNGGFHTPAAPPIPDFSLSVSPSSQTVVQGSPATFNLSTAAINGYTGTLVFSATPAITGAAYNFNPSSAPVGAGSVLTVTTSLSTPASTYAITVRATDGTLSHTFPISLVVTAAPQADFSLSLSIPSKTMNAGSVGTDTVSNVGVNGFVGNITLSIAPPISGVVFGFAPNPMAHDASSTLTITPSPGSGIGTNNLTVTGVSGALTHSIPLTLILTSAPVHTQINTVGTPTSNSVQLTLQVNNNGDPGGTDLYVRYRKQTDPVNTYIEQLLVNGQGKAVGAADSIYSYTLGPQLLASTNYFVWAYSSNNAGFEEEPALHAFTTAAGGSSTSGTISAPPPDFNWLSYGQATLFFDYTTGAGVYRERMHYSVNQDMSAEVVTAFETIPTNNTAVPASWDRVIGGLLANTKYYFFFEMDDTVNLPIVTAVQNFTTSIQPTGITANGYLSVFPGSGPGGRLTPFGAVGQAPGGLSAIATYADPRRPSSGLITETNPRKFPAIPNIAANPTYAAANLAAYAAFAANNGYDIVCYMPGHGVGGRSNFDIEIWDPYTVKALGGAAATPPYIVNAAAHGKGAKAVIQAIKAFARHSDVVGVLGASDQINFCGSSSSTESANSEACWITISGSTHNGRTIVGVAVQGMSALGAASQFVCNTACGFGSRLGSLTNVHFFRCYGLGLAGTTNQYFNYSANNGDNVNNNWTLSGLTGLHGWYNSKVEIAATATQQGGYGFQHICRTFCASNRPDFRDNQLQWGREHVFYLDNPGPKKAGVESGAAAPWFVLRNAGIGGLSFGPKDGCTKDSFKIAARFEDHVNNCASCLAGACSGSNTCNTSDGPDGEGHGYVIDNVFKGQTAVSVPHDYVIGGHHGIIDLKALGATGSLMISYSAGCCDKLRPVTGADGFTYATSSVVVRDYQLVVNTPSGGSKAVLKVEGIVKLVIQNLTLPVGLTVYPIALCCGEFSNVLPNSQPIGFTQLTMANPLHLWAGWPGSGQKMKFAFDDGGSTSLGIGTTTPPLIGHVYTDTEMDSFFFGVCRLDLPAPPVGGSVGCPNA